MKKTQNNKISCLNQSELNELRGKIGNIVLEYMQQAEKLYFKPGKLSDKVKNVIIEKITHGDNYTRIICDIYYAILQQNTHRGEWALAHIEGREHVRPKEYKPENDFLPIEDWKKIKSYYQQLKEYNKNVFPIKNLSLSGVKEIWDLIKCLEYREEIIKNMKLLPSIATRNLKEDIRQARNSSEMNDYRYNLEDFINYVSQIGNRDEKMREVIFRKMFKANTTMEDLLNFVQEKENLIGGASFTKKKVKELVKEFYSGLEIVFEKGNIMVVEVDSPKGMKAIGCNSLWCFTYGESNWTQFNQYSTNGIVYTIIDFSKKSDDIDFMHVLIKPIDWESEFDEDDNTFESNSLFSMDNDPTMTDPKQFAIYCVGSEENAKRIFNFGEEVESEEDKKERQYKIDLVKSKAHNIFNELYGSADKSIPSFDEFYKQYLEQYSDDNSLEQEEVKRILKDTYKDLTKENPNQMSLFEIQLRKKIRKLLSSNI